VGVRPATPASLLLVGSSVIAIGVLAALTSVVALTLSTPVKLAFALGGLALLIPTMVVKDAKALWLFLLVLSIPFDISKWMSAWVVSPQALVDTYGMPASEIITLELYLTDVVLLAMVLPWLARVCLKRERLYFPGIGYLFVFYLVWALIVSLINAQSLYLSMIELCREALYFLFFVYLMNNVTTPLQFRSVVLAVFVGLTIGASSVIISFEQGIGTETIAFTGLHDQTSEMETGALGKITPSIQPLTLHNKDLSHGVQHDDEIKRSQGMFRHPAIAASLCGLTLPIVLAYFMAARKNRDRIVYVGVLAWGVIGLLLTFSRAGLIGLLVGTLVVFLVGGWSGLVSRRALKWGAVALTFTVTLSVPLLGAYLNTRPETFSMRFNLFEASLQGYWQHPILGVGLNNGTAAMKSGKEELRSEGIPVPAEESADNHYLAVMTEVGPVGFILFFVFFGKIVMVALDATREAPTEVKPLLVGIVGGLASLAIQNLSDDALAGHAISAMLWLFAGLIIVIARKLQAEKQHTPFAGLAIPSGPNLHRAAGFAGLRR
jgi:O-Antigen ligase